MIDLDLTYVEVRVKLFGKENYHVENYFQTLSLFHIFFKTAPLLINLKEHIL